MNNSAPHSTELATGNSQTTSLPRAHISELINDSLWRLAEEETLLLMRKYNLTAIEVIRQYTGKTLEIAGMDDAIKAIYQFNINAANRNGFVVY